MFQTILMLVFMFSVIPNQETRGWQGLIPLHSRRADVKRLLGRSSDQCNCIYETQEEFIHFDYAISPCKGSLPGWNVPADTVLSIKVRPKKDLKFSELGIVEGRYTKNYDDAMATYYTDNEKGISYVVTESGLVNSITYIPTLSDNALRCHGWPLLSNKQSFINPRPFDDYSDIPWRDETGRLDNFAIALQQDPKLTGYVIVYAGQRACVGEAESRARRAKKYLVETRGIEESRIKWIDGGYREELTVILQPVPPGVSEIMTSPTVKPADVKLKKNCKSPIFQRKRSRF
jgi:hypothetical protein